MTTPQPKKNKLQGIEEGAEANQDAFTIIKVGSTSISADLETDTLIFEAGSNITLTPDATNDKITIAATNTTYSNATTSAAGLMSASDKSKLDGIETGANKITVDSAMSSTSTNPVQNKIVNSALSGKAPTNHASTSTTYGIGDYNNFGHVKLIQYPLTPDESGENWLDLNGNIVTSAEELINGTTGLAASACAVSVLYAVIDAEFSDINNNLSELALSIQNRVNKMGDTMTGNLIINKTVSSATGTVGLLCQRTAEGSENRIDALFVASDDTASMIYRQYDSNGVKIESNSINVTKDGITTLIATPISGNESNNYLVTTNTVAAYVQAEIAKIADYDSEVF